MNNKFSTKNTKLYRMKCINTRNQEYTSIEKEPSDRKERYN